MKAAEPRTGARSHALRVLEFDEVLGLVAEGAVGPEGAARVRGLAPLADAEEIERALDAVEELRSLLAGDGFDLEPVPEADGALARLAIDGAVLDPGQLLVCARILAASRAARRDLAGATDPGGLVETLADRLWHDRELESRIASSFDDSGGVADGASAELRRIRRELRAGRSRLVQRLETFAGSLPERVRVPDASVTVRSGRYCVPIRREGKGSVGGLVHDASGSGQTLFVEPPLAIEAMNEIRELEVAEEREVRRVLAELSDTLRDGAGGGGVDALRASYDALARLDSLRARALFALRLDGTRPSFAGEADSIRIRAGRHPLLAARGGEVVPYDLELAPEERVLLISGPNAGGKTVLLKSIGLFAALTQSGVIPPVGRGTRLPRFRALFAIIGDEQSIEASLSTFGAQARNLARILDDSAEGDLVLIDEIGSATDPAEGAALAAATLAALAKRVRLTVATTHLGDLKGLADEGIPAVNASLQFDSRRLEPTFRLERDRPGRSYALEIASRLGVPREVLEDARARLDHGHRALDDVLARLEEEQRAARELRADLERREAAVAETERELEAGRRRLERETREAERGRNRIREEALLEARAEVEETITRLERDMAAAAGSQAVDEAKRAARSDVERRLRETRERGRSLEDAGPDGPAGERPTVGEPVAWSGSGRVGRLVEIRGDRGVVEVDGVRLTLPVDDLRPGEGPDEASSGTTGAGPGPGGDERRPEFEVRTELDLRGLRAEEVEGALLPALDAAIVAELPWLRIIHGKGTGALRSVVQELLDRDPRIPGYRTGDPREGGTGVTVVEF